jgi:hypothetical protein
VAAILFVVARAPVVASVDGFYNGVVSALQRVPGFGDSVPPTKSERSWPAQLAQPRDQR